MIPGFQKALQIFRHASSHIPAYKTLLKKQGINPYIIQTFKDFQTLPIIEKKTYVYQYPLEDLFPKKAMPPMGYASSGSSGKPTFWFRDTAHEKRGGELHELIFRDMFQIRKTDPTLVIVCFSMGIWIAGNYTLASCRNVAQKGYNITTVTPGIEKEDIIHVLKDLAPHFKHVVIAGYPPFLMDVFHEIRKRGIPIHQSIKILTAGDKFSEQWREDIAKLLTIKTPYQSIGNIYGCADAGILGFETPLSVYIRKNAARNTKLYKELFGNAKNLPGIFQYNPNDVFFEEHQGELLFTVPTAAPLIRYNIHDIGNIYSYQKIQELLKKYGLEKESKRYGITKWSMPFVTVKGRTDVAVTFYALNIYPEHIKQGIEDKRVSRFLSGNYFAYNKTTNHSKSQKLYMDVELAQGIKPNKAIVKTVQEAITQKLLKINTEFRKLYSILGSKALPLISLKEYGNSNFQTHNRKGILHMKGKKLKMSS